MPDDVAAIRSQAIREFCDKAGLRPLVEVQGLPDDVKIWRLNEAVKNRRTQEQTDE